MHDVDADPAQWRGRLEAAGLPAHWADALTEVFACYRENGPVRTDTVAELLAVRPGRSTCSCGSPSRRPWRRRARERRE